MSTTEFMVAVHARARDREHTQSRIKDPFQNKVYSRNNLFTYAYKVYSIIYTKIQREYLKKE